MINFLFFFSKESLLINLDKCHLIRPQSYVSLENQEAVVSFWGDPIFPDEINGFIKRNEILKAEWLIKNVAGHYYYLIYNKKDEKIVIGSSFMSILPLYYANTPSGLSISNSPEYITPLIGNNKLNKRFILENIIFNYNLFNSTYHSDINLLPTNHCIIFQGKSIKIHKLLFIDDMFVDNPISCRNAKSFIPETFIQTTKKYFPDQPFVSALTGGFDGRTLVATALFHNKIFSTYTFGSKTSEDVIIAKKIASEIGIEHTLLSLDENYGKKFSLANGIEFINNSSGTAAFARAHYLFAAKELKSKTNYIITGNFGSEILRSVHNEGIMISSNLYKLFASQNYSQAIDTIENSMAFKWLNLDEFKQEWAELKEDIKNLPCFNPLFNSLTKNQQFYLIVFEEVFRKYFGAELINQFNYLNNRTPFLDFKFFSEILKTQFAGVYSEFFTHNPIKRFKGQTLYAHIIDKSWPLLNKPKTGKGYAPGDLLNFPGNMKIAYSFLNKRIKLGKLQSNDDFYVERSLSINIKYFLNQDRKLIFNNKLIDDCINRKLINAETLHVLLSQIYWHNKINY